MVFVLKLQRYFNKLIPAAMLDAFTLSSFHVGNGCPCPINVGRRRHRFHSLRAGRTNSVWPGGDLVLASDDHQNTPVAGYKGEHWQGVEKNKAKHSVSLQQHSILLWMQIHWPTTGKSIKSNFIMKCDKRTQSIESSVRMTVQKNIKRWMVMVMKK